MRFLIVFFFLFISLNLFAEDEPKYQAYGKIHFERDGLACEIQNNIGDTGRVHKVAFDMQCLDGRSRRLYSAIKVIRCGEDYQNCDIEGYDFEVFHSGSLRSQCFRVHSARCRFIYSFPDELNDIPDLL